MEAIREFLTVEAHNGYGYGSGDVSGDGIGYGRANGKGYGSGDGIGYGRANGEGYGRSNGEGDGGGYGSGSGEGYGYANGEGYGIGYGSGYGFCSGNGDGIDDGYGDGDVYGSGSGIKSYCGRTVYNIDDVPTLLYHVHGNIAKGAILKTDLTLEPCYVVKSGNLYAHGETLREAQAALQDKLFEDMPVEERIQAFLAEFKPGIEYPVKEFYDWHHRLTGSCEMGRKSFAKEHGIDIEHGMMTVEKFIQLTKNAYGGDVIKEIIGRLRE